MAPKSISISHRADIGNLRVRLLLMFMLICAAVLLGSAARAADPDNVSFTLEGCRNDGTITFSEHGPFICADADYTTGNLGKGWNELDLVPFRLTAEAKNAAASSQTYTIVVALDNQEGGVPGYDVLQTLTLNTDLSSASCTAATVGAQTTLMCSL